MIPFIFGAGYSARAFAGAAGAEAARIFGTTRTAEKFPVLRAAGIEPFVFDGAAVSDAVRDALRTATHLIVSIAPGEAGDPVLRAFPDLRSAMPALEWIGYLSTVGVYGDHGGAWVDEATPCRPVSKRSVERVAAEQAWQDAAARAGAPLAVLRLSGIYGPGRNAFVNLENGTAKRLVKAGQVFNRIHVADIAGALLLLSKRRLGGIYNVTDDLPAPPQDVVAHAAGLMGMAAPPEEDFETAALSPMARSFYGENKRVSNAAIKKAGYSFQFPDYRAALSALWRDGDWRASESSPARSRMRD